MRTLKIKAVVYFFFLSLSSTMYSQTCLQNANHPGYYTLTQTTASGNNVREYILFVPSNYNSEISTPLVINMHGFGDCAADFSESVGEYYELNDLADQENFIIAYPQGAYRPEKEDNYWEPGDNGASDIYENDVYFLEQLVQEIDIEYNLDLSKVFAMGYSNGGMMAYSLACNRSDLISAIGIMSGTMLQENCTLENPVPVIKFHGIGDEVLPYEGNIWYQSVEEVVNFWLNLNNIMPSSKVSSQLNDGKIERDEYTNSDNSSCLTLYTVVEEYDKPGEHVWFSEEINGSSPNEIVWEYFSQRCASISSVNDPTLGSWDFKINQNLISQNIRIDAESIINKAYSIFDIHGNRLKFGKINTTPLVIDLRSLSPSMYFLEIQGKIKKFVKSE